MLLTEFIGKVIDMAILHIYKTTVRVATVLCVCNNKSYLDTPPACPAWFIQSVRVILTSIDSMVHLGEDARTAINWNFDSILVCYRLNSSEKSLIWLYYIYIKRPYVFLQCYVSAATNLTLIQRDYSAYVPSVIYTMCESYTYIDQQHGSPWRG